MGVDVNTVAFIGVKLTGTKVIDACFEWEDEYEAELNKSGVFIITDGMCGEFCYIGEQLLLTNAYMGEIKESFHEEFITRIFLEIGLKLRDLDMPDIIREAVDKEDIQLHIFNWYT